jgi:acyl-CoA thioesterase-1
MFLGDSLTAGYRLKVTEAYPALLESEWKKKDKDIVVVNGGVSGDTTAGGLRRLDWMLRQAQPNVVVIALGANDMLRGLPLARTKANLEKIIQESQKSGARVILMALPAVPSLGEAYAKEFNSLFQDLSKKYSVPLLPDFLKGVAGQSKLNLSDGIHPNAEGHRLIAETVGKFLNPLLEKSK